jgi:hypothetical protein
VSATFIFLMVVLKIPIFALFYIVWWAVHSPPETEPATDEDGGSKRPLNPRPRHPHPRPALPRNPRRGPHGGAAAAARADRRRARARAASSTEHERRARSTSLRAP